MSECTSREKAIVLVLAIRDLLDIVPREVMNPLIDYLGEVISEELTDVRKGRKGKL